MIAVEHQLEIHINRLDNAACLICMIEEIPRRIMMIQRFDQDGAAMSRCGGAGIAQIFDETGLSRVIAGKARQDMNVCRIDGIGVIKRCINAGTRFLFTPDQCRQPVSPAATSPRGAFSPSMERPVACSAVTTALASSS